MIDLGLTVTVYCANGHHKRLKLAALRSRFGPDAGVMEDDILPRMGACSTCGARAESVIVSPEMSAAGHPINVR